MRRRDVITLAGGATAWSVAVRAQLATKVQAVAFLLTNQHHR
jgi:hypothetical protein